MAEDSVQVDNESEIDPGNLGEGIGLCLSGGGFRAMLFHVGAVQRLNELGLLHQLKRVSSVSGGSITAGVLGANWGALGFQLQNDGRTIATKLDEAFVAPLTRNSHSACKHRSLRGRNFFA